MRVHIILYAYRLLRARRHLLIVGISFCIFSDTTMKDVTTRLSNLVTEYYNQNVKLNEKITELEEQIRVVKYHSM